MTAGSDRGTLVKSLDRAIDVVEALARHPGGVSVTDLAQALRMPKSSAFRVLNTLRQRGYVRQDAGSERYFLGLGFLPIAEALERSLDIRSLALPHLEALRDATRETVHLAVPDGTSMVSIVRLESPQPIRTVSRVGQRSPLHSTALGKAYLSALPDQEREAVVRGLQLEARTDRTVTDAAALLRELQAARDRGFAIDNAENSDGVCCVGARVADRAGRPVAAISITAPTSRFSATQALSAGPLVATTANAVSRELGAPTR